MIRMSLRSKLLLAFLIVLLPMLALILYGYRHEYGNHSETAISDQLRTAQAIAALVDASIEDGFSVAGAFSKDPIVRTMDNRQISPYFADLASFLPQLDDIAVFDMDGNNVSSMKLQLPPDAHDFNIADRKYFREIKSSSMPVVSTVQISPATGNPVVVVAVPILNELGTTIGVAVADLSMDYLARRVATVGLRPSQAIFLTDQEGTIGFHTALPRGDWGHLTDLCIDI